MRTEWNQLEFAYNFKSLPKVVTLCCLAKAGLGREEHLLVVLDAVGEGLLLFDSSGHVLGDTTDSQADLVLLLQLVLMEVEEVEDEALEGEFKFKPRRGQGEEAIALWEGGPCFRECI